jgi:cell division septation protein DedD
MMSKKKKRKKGTGQGSNFVISLVTLSILFVLVGYLIGQYAVKALQQQHRMAMQQAREAAYTPVVTPQPSSTTPAPPAPSASVQETQPPPSQEPQAQPAPSTALYRVQVGVFSERANAERMVAQLKEAGYEALIISGPPHRVQTGAFSSQENANNLAEELKRKGFEAIVVR